MFQVVRGIVRAIFMLMAHGVGALHLSDFIPSRFFDLKVFDWFKSYFSGYDYDALGIYDSKLHTASCRINEELIQGQFYLTYFHPRCALTNKCRQHSDKFVLGSIDRPVHSVHYSRNVLLHNLL